MNTQESRKIISDTRRLIVRMKSEILTGNI